jgi:hypothetical protein
MRSKHFMSIVESKSLERSLRGWRSLAGGAGEYRGDVADHARAKHRRNPRGREVPTGADVARHIGASVIRYRTP